MNEHPILTMWDQFANLDAYEAHVLETSDQEITATETRVAEIIASGRMHLSF